MKKKIIKLTYITIFCLLIALPLFQLNTNFFTVEKLDEKREKAKKPTYSYKADRIPSEDPNIKGNPVTLDRFIQDFDKYFKDNFGFREDLIRLSNIIDYRVFNKTTTPKVVIGKDDYLFIDEEIGDYDRTSTLKDAEIDLIAYKIKMFQDELSKRGIDFLFTLAPNKSTIYPEYMYRPSKNPTLESNYDKLSKALVAKGVKYLDLKSFLLENKSKYPLYYKRDTHWNKISATLVADTVIKNLGAKYGVDGGLKVGDIIMENYPGDLDGMLGINSGIPEYSTNKILTKPSIKLPKTICYYDSFSFEVLPLLNEFSSQRVDLHNLNSPLYFTYPMFYNNNKIVYFELVERYINKMVEYDFEVFDNNTADIDKLFTPRKVELDTAKNPKIALHNTMSETLKDKGYTYFASTKRDSYITFEVDKQDVHYMYIELDHIDDYTKIKISCSPDGENYSDAKAMALEFNPIKKKYVLNFKDKGKDTKFIKFQFEDQPNKEFNIKEFKLY